MPFLNDMIDRSFTRFLAIMCAGCMALTSCQTIRHQFLDPSRDWQARIGQLLYNGKRTTADRRGAGAVFKKRRFRTDLHQGPRDRSIGITTGRPLRQREGPARPWQLVWICRDCASAVAGMAGVARNSSWLRTANRHSVIPPVPKLLFSAFDLRWLKRERRACRYDLSCACIPSSLISSRSGAARSGPRSR